MKLSLSPSYKFTVVDTRCIVWTFILSFDTAQHTMSFSSCWQSYKHQFEEHE